MKKLLFLFIFSLIAMSCSKKVEVSGKLTNASPLDRIEFIDASGVGTLPLLNVGIDKDGNFKGSFDAPKNGMYVMSYGGRQNLIYLKKGQSLVLNANGMAFPAEYTITGDAKANNDFLKNAQKFLMDYSAKLNMDQKMQLKEADFVKEMQKIQKDINKNIEDNAAKYKADKEVVDYKKRETNAGILSVMGQYELFKQQTSGNPSYKAPKVMSDFEITLVADKEQMIKEHPVYRTYLLGKMNDGFQKFAMAKVNGQTDLLTTDLFKEFIANNKDYSQTIKDYLTAFIMVQADLRPDQTPANLTKLKTIIDNDIKDAEVKKDLQHLHYVVTGPKIGEAAPAAKLEKVDGTAYKIAEAGNKPKMLMFYASWNPYIQDAAIPVLRQVVDFYKSKMDFVFINMDDSKDQFNKTSAALLKSVPGTNVYADGGMQSELANKYGIYSFKLNPAFLLVDKDGKVASKYYYNLGDPEMITMMDKLTGLKAPAVEPEITLQNDLLAPQQQQQPTQQAPSAQQQPPAPAAAK